MNQIKKKMMNKEIRTIDVYENTEIRAQGESRQISGYGIVFNKESRDLGGFQEVILPEAIEGVIEESDILVLMNHDINRGILARSSKGLGSLRTTTDIRGVIYAFKSPRTSLGDELVEGIARGDIKGSSFAFTVLPDGEQWERRDDGTVLRTIKKFDKIYDMSPCYREAYQDTTIALRSLDEYKRNNDELTDMDINPAAAKTTAESLKEEKVMPALSNSELAMRARNEMYEKNNI